MNESPIIERNGAEFQLPDDHAVEVLAGKNGPETYAWLRSDVGGSLFRLSASVEQRGDARVFQLAEEVATDSPAFWRGEEIIDLGGYPLPV
jgi:hypothetical protein